jgi:hypothetical protein
MEIVKAPGDAILHLSDLHFGSDYGFPLVRPIPGRGMDALPLVEKISSRIFQELGIRVGVVVVSGDLITRGLQMRTRTLGAFWSPYSTHLT